MPLENEEGRPQRALQEVKGTPRSGVRSIWRSSKENVAESQAAASATEAGPRKPPIEPALRPGPKPPVRERLAFIGHGGMPIELGWKQLPKDGAPVVFSDERYSGRTVERSGRASAPARFKVGADVLHGDPLLHRYAPLARLLV